MMICFDKNIGGIFMAIISNNELSGVIKDIHSKYNLKFVTINDLPTAKRYILKISETISNSIVIDIETSGLDVLRDKMLGVVIGYTLKNSLYINTRNWNKEDKKELVSSINSMSNKIVMHNSFFDCSFTGVETGLALRYDYDTMVIAYCLFTHKVYRKESIGLKDLSREFTPYGDYEQELVDFKKHYSKTNKVKVSEFKYSMIPDEVLTPYALMDGIANMYLFNVLMKKVNSEVENGWVKLNKLIETKTRVTKHYIEAKISGFSVDTERVITLYNEWKVLREDLLKGLKSMREIKKSLSIIKRDLLTKSQVKRKSKLPLSRCRKLWNDLEFNFNSNNHLRVLFFDVLGLEVIKKTDKGEPSTDREVMEYWADKGHPFMAKLQEYLTINKGISDFLGVEGTTGIWNHITEEHHKVHSNFNHCGTVSSRTATSNLNLSQVPSRGELKKIKQCYKLDEGRKLIQFDYSSAELFIATSISQEENYFNILNNNLDFHSVNALAFEDKMTEMPDGLPYEDKLKFIKENYGDTWRYYAKALGFSLLYGGTEHSLSKTLSIPKKQAKDVVDSFLKKNQGIKKYIEDTKDFACKYGYVENFYGQRVQLPECLGYNWRVSYKKNYKALGNLRFAINFKIQSANAFLLYEGMIDFFEKVKEKKWDINLLCTIYDAVYLDVDDSIDSKEVANLLKECFEVDFFGVGMKIDVGQSDTGRWYDCDNIKL